MSSTNNIPYQYGGQIKLGQSIEFLNKAPLDVRVTVKSLEQLYLIPYPYIGLVSYVINQGALYVCTSVKGDNNMPVWQLAVDSAGTEGLNIYDYATIKLLKEAGTLPNKYIAVSDGTSDLGLIGDPVTKTYSYSGTGNYADILFAAVRELQNEVTRLRNAFKYGIYSYTGTETAMSATIADLTSEEEDSIDEPIWAIDESALSSVYECNIGKNWDKSFTPANGTDVDFTTYTNCIVISSDDNNASLTWTDAEDNTIEKVTDNKLFLYITATTKNISITFGDTQQKADTDIVNRIVSIKHILGESHANAESDLYNIMICISRQYESETDDSLLTDDSTSEDDTSTKTGPYGLNYVYLSISNGTTNKTIVEGYLGTNENEKTVDILSEQLDKDTELDYRYFFKSITISDCKLYKMSFYSKQMDLSNEITPEKPDDEEYRYKAAHITIRAVENNKELTAVKQYLPENELVWQKDTRSLWIKSNGMLVAIGSANTNNSNTDTGDTMTDTEILEILEKKGIVYTDENGLQLSNVSGVTFINTNTNTKYEYCPDSEGNLIGREVSNTNFDALLTSLQNTWPGTIDSMDDSNYSIRGFFGTYYGLKNGIGKSSYNTDFGLGSDRVKIGAIYSPYKSQEDTGVYGCSHAYIELENTSDEDFPLDGFYLHYACPKNGSTKVYHLALKGIIKAGSTYLIRGKKYAEFTDACCFIKVETFDQEWYVEGELIDLSVDDSLSTSDESNAYALALTYGLPNLKATDKLVKIVSADADITALGISSTKSNSPNLYHLQYVDSLNWYAPMVSNTAYIWWPSTASVVAKKNSIIKNNFELDPAKQAYQALTKHDSSRVRANSITYASGGCDIQMLELNDECITFKYSDEEYPVSNWTPMASYCNKNVSTDKTKLDKDKPNMLTCSFGINPYTTRCFNWISCGAFDEYIFIRKQGTTTWEAFESYKTTSEMGDEVSKSDYPKRKRYTDYVKNGYKVDKDTEGAKTVEDIVYSRIISRFPGDNSLFTAHKLILDVFGSNNHNVTTFEYIAGRMLKDGTPDPDHTSEIYTFTCYPSSDDYTPRIYQTTDQQGFIWIEYQAWTAAAKKLNELIESETKNDNIIPVLINTGDMTQNGTRINEWLDYYNAGKCLFKHLEQCNVVGNNDLCGTNPLELGTGDDAGKSNSYYFHVFYCQEVEVGGENIKSGITPVCNGKYVPSLYGIKFSKNYFLFVNSEFTKINCQDWFGLTGVDGSSTVPVNIYTGWTIPTSSSTNSVYTDSFTSVYTMIYQMLTKYKGTHVTAICHEMPFTVITNDSLNKGNTNILGISRCFGGVKTTALIGSHLNQMDNNEKVIYWFSRLLEYFGVNLCLGGHKHTYAITYPVRERYTYTEDDTTYTSLQKIMIMSETLENDNAIWTYTVGDEDDTCNGLTEGTTLHTSKFPYVKRPQKGTNTDKFYPYTPIEDLTGGITYFMCQATGFKLKSNKELPSQQQAFSELIPLTNVDSSGSDKPSSEQQYPMFGVVEYDTSTSDVKATLYLVRIDGILNNKSLNQQRPTVDDAMHLQYIKSTDIDSKTNDYTNNFGEWQTGENKDKKTAYKTI